MTSASGRAVRPRRLALLSTLCVALGVMIVHVRALIALIAPAILGVLVLSLLVRGMIQWGDEDARRRILYWAMIAFAAHLLFGLASTNVSDQIRFYVGTDSFSYDAGARALVQHWNLGLPAPVIPTGKEGFYYLLAGLYWIFGAHTAAGLAVNSTLAAGLVPVMTDATDRLFGRAAARYAAPLVVLLPGLFLWTSQLMRESGILFLLAVALNCAIRLTERVTLASLLVLTTAMVFAFTFRAPVALIAAAGLLVGIGIGHRDLARGLSTGVTTVIVVALVMVVSGLGYSGYKSAVNVNLNKADVVRKDLALSGGTGFAVDADISTPGNALAYLPRGLATFLIGPFPWQIRSARQLPFMPDMLVWWLLLPSLKRGYVMARDLVGRRRLLMVLPASGIVVFMALALGNFGTIVRERLQFIVLVVPLVALGLAHRASGGVVPDEHPPPPVEHEMPSLAR